MESRTPRRVAPRSHGSVGAGAGAGVNGAAANGVAKHAAGRRSTVAATPTTAAGAERFDRAYYERFYGRARTRVATPASTARLARFVCSYLKHLGQPVHTVLDLGCGLGFWRPVVQRQFPRARYTGVEVSSYLCRTHGWRRGSVVDFRARAPADLVICQGVLQYLPAALARRAIANLGRLCRGALYLEALTTEDWEQNCDTTVTDGEVHLRPAAWYRRELAKRFTSCGGGVFLAEESPAVMFELEKP